MDALIIAGWLALTALLLRLRDNLGAGGWRVWQRLREPPESVDPELVRGLSALYRMEDYAEWFAAQGDSAFAAQLSDAARIGDESLPRDLEDGLGRWRRLTPLLSMARPVRSLAERGLRDRPLRALAAAESALLRLPGGRRGHLVRFRRHLLVLRLAAAIVRVRLRRLEKAGRARAREAAAALRDEQERVVRASLEAYHVLLLSLHARREQIYGARH